MNLAQAEVEVEGLQTLLLPAERVTAIHEAGHAVNGFRLGSSLDKWVMASRLVQGAALALRRDPEVLLASCIGATLYVLQREYAVIAAVQHHLIRESGGIASGDTIMSVD